MSKLIEIFEHKHAEVEGARSELPLAELQARARDLPPCRGFRQALVDDSRPVALIAEVKKASPSQGMIRLDFDAVAVALEYARAGVTCLSVLTDEKYFQGSPENLRRIRAETTLPILRKDFIFDAYQLWEARTWGADAVLLIVAGLSPALLGGLFAEARSLGLDVLVEVHSESETDAALALGADLIGVNNRDLSTFITDLSTSDRLLPRIAPVATAVAESALASFDDVDRVTRAGARAVLIGTTFCAAPSIESKVKEVMHW